MQLHSVTLLRERIGHNFIHHDALDETVKQAGLALLILLIGFPLLAADINRELQQGGMTPENRNGGYLDIGLGVGMMQNPIYGIPEGNDAGESNWHPMVYVNINGRYQYRNFYVEANSEAVHGFNMGYNFYDDGTWTADILFSHSFDGFGPDDSEDWEGFSQRHPDLGAGFRFGYYNPNYICQFRFQQDVSGAHGGQNASIFFGKSWQVRNWNYHALVGVTYYSSKLLDYYFGIDESEAKEGFPATRASAGYMLDAEIGLAYPLAEDWVFRAGYRYGRLPNNATDSALVVRENYQILATSLNYVF